MKTKISKRRMFQVGVSLAALILFGLVVIARAQEGLKVTAVPPAAPAAAGPAAPAVEPAAPTLAGPETVEPTTADGCVVDSSKAEIMIGLSYYGDKIEFFGTTGQTRADAVIAVLSSPVETVKLNQKGRVLFVWMNTKQHLVENVPFMYKVHASKPLDQIASAETLRGLGIGFEAIRDRLVIKTVKGESDPADPEIIFQGLLKLKMRQNLYKIDDRERIVIKENALFKHYFIFPPAAKEGDYIVETFLFRDGRLVGRAAETIHIEKVGLEAKIVHWANRHPKTYGVCAVIIALSAGLLVGSIFKGGGH